MHDYLLLIIGETFMEMQFKMSYEFSNNILNNSKFSLKIHLYFF